MIFLITPTGARPQQFKLCMQWMKNQTYLGRVCWIVIDDCKPRTTDILTDDFRENWTIIKKYPRPYWKEGGNTQSRNLQIAVDIIKNYPKTQVEAIFVIEDDDYYKPNYLSFMINRLDGNMLTGELETTYYNIPKKKYHKHNNRTHSSLFQICFTYSAIPVLESSLGNRWIDIEFCRRMNELGKARFFKGLDLSIGIKGLPGRSGIGIGHKMIKGTEDFDLKKFKELLGDDYKFYVND